MLAKDQGLQAWEFIDLAVKPTPELVDLSNHRPFEASQTAITALYGPKKLVRSQFSLQHHGPTPLPPELPSPNSFSLPLFVEFLDLFLVSGIFIAPPSSSHLIPRIFTSNPHIIHSYAEFSSHDSTVSMSSHRPFRLLSNACRAPPAPKWDLRKVLYWAGAQGLPSPLAAIAAEGEMNCAPNVPIPSYVLPRYIYSTSMVNFFQMRASGVAREAMDDYLVAAS
ncbi:hypothetical protein FNAPI_686 [Fusarium napiforme]|uniref:Uncharacterized protein n=1 Tax=Fusarium napiforme TaxID=42672 RepID=A0A8H5NI82_9HYPO|nr:hypothetical protein FNAPI_686 [Fusarium napiforme]